VQVLLTPLIVPLAPVALQNLLANAQQLESLGLIMEQFGTDAVAVRQVAALIKDADLEKMINELATAYGEKKAHQRHLEKACSLMACHAAIRGKRQMSQQEILTLIAEMKANPKASQCNHGRPTLIALTQADLDKLFER